MQSFNADDEPPLNASMTFLILLAGVLFTGRFDGKAEMLSLWQDYMGVNVQS